MTRAGSRTKCIGSLWMLLLLLLCVTEHVSALTPPRINTQQGRKSPKSKSTTTTTSTSNRPVDTFELATASSGQEAVLTVPANSKLVAPPKDLSSSSSSAPLVGVASQELPLLQLALAGSLATFVADLVLHPMDCIKTLQQSDLGLHWTMFESAQYLYQQSGPMGFFHGFWTYGLADAVAGAVKFGVWETWKKQSPTFSSESSCGSSSTPSHDPIWFVMTGAALAFVASSVVIVPGEFLKQQLQMSHFDGLWHAIQGVAFNADDGSVHLQRLFTGYNGVLLRDVPYTILELGLYDTLKRFWDERTKSSLAKTSSSNKDDTQEATGVVWENLLCAAATGVVAAVVTTPMDVIKTKLMVDDYASLVDCFVSTMQTHGLWSGVAARVSWIVPFTMLYLPTYDGLKTWMWYRHVQHYLNRRTVSLDGVDDVVTS